MNLTLEVQAAVAGLQEYRIPEVGNDGRGVTCYVQPALVKVLIEALTIPDWYYADGAEHRVCRDWEAAGEGALAGRLSRVLADYGLLLVTKADGPGFVARITPNQLDAKTLVEVWDDGGFKLDGPPDRSPNMDKPALAATMQMMEQLFGRKL